jgi:hypothetical protein
VVVVLERVFLPLEVLWVVQKNEVKKQQQLHLVSISTISIIEKN